MCIDKWTNHQTNTLWLPIYLTFFDNQLIDYFLKCQAKKVEKGVLLFPEAQADKLKLLLSNWQ